MSSRTGLIIRRRDGKGGYAGTRDMTKARRAANRAMQRAILRSAAASTSLSSSRGLGPVYGRPSGNEVKGVDADVSQSLIATTSTNAGIDVINLIEPGTGSWNRVGRKTVLKSFRLTGNIVWTNTPTLATGVGRMTCARCVLVWDSQPTGTIPVFSDIFGSTLQAGTEQVTSIFDPLRYDNMERFRVIRDWRLSPPATVPLSLGSAPSMAVCTHIDEYVKLPPLQSNYSGQSSPQTIADIASGALYLIWRAEIQNSNAATVVDAMARLRYYD